MDAFFMDCLSDPNINWNADTGIVVRHYMRTFSDGVKISESIVEVPLAQGSSPQSMGREELIKQGFGDEPTAEWYSMFVVGQGEAVEMNTDAENYRTIIFNGREYEITACEFMGVHRLEPMENGYRELTIKRTLATLGG